MIDRAIHRLRVVTAIFGLLAFTAVLSAERAQLQPLPSVLHPVSDAADVLSIPEGRALADRLSKIERRTKAKIIVMVMPSVAPESIDAYTQRLAIHWRNKGKIREDGRFLFVVIAKEDRIMRFQPSRRLAWIAKPLEESETVRNVPALLADAKYYQALTDIAETVAQILTARMT